MSLFFILLLEVRGEALCKKKLSFLKEVEALIKIHTVGNFESKSTGFYKNLQISTQASKRWLRFKIFVL